MTSTTPTDPGIDLVHAHRFESLDPERAQVWASFPGGSAGRVFPHLVGFQLVELRRDYAAVHLPFRPELRQPAGVVHGGVIATLIDSVVVPAIGAGYDDDRSFATIELGVRYLGAVVDENLVAEGWVRQRGRSIAFCEAEVHTTAGRLVAAGTATYKISSAKPATASSPSSGG